MLLSLGMLLLFLAHDQERPTPGRCLAIAELQQSRLEPTLALFRADAAREKAGEPARFKSAQRDRLAVALEQDLHDSATVRQRYAGAAITDSDRAGPETTGGTVIKTIKACLKP